MKEEIQIAFQSANLEKSTQQTVIELYIDGPNSVTATTLSKAHMNQIMTSLRKEFHLVPKNEERGANTGSASMKKKKNQEYESCQQGLINHEEEKQEEGKK